MQEPTAEVIFAERLSAARKDREMSQVRMSELLRENYGVQIDPTGILRIEKGQRSPRLDEVVAMSDLLNIQVEDLLRIPSFLSESLSAPERYKRTTQLKRELARLEDEIGQAAADAANARIERRRLEERRDQVQLRLAALQASEKRR